MKLLSSIKRELTLASRSFYFYIEIGLAALILVVLMFVVPDEFETRNSMYIYIDENMPMETKDYLYGVMLEEDQKFDDGIIDEVEVELGDQTELARLYKLEDDDYYLIDDKEFVIEYGDKKRKFSVVIQMNNDFSNYEYTYFMQGYESQRLVNAFKVFHSKKIEVVRPVLDNQRITALSDEFNDLSDKQNILPVILTFIGILMGMFLIVSYVFLDKGERVIRAYAVTASPIRGYLVSKIAAVLVSSLLSTMIIVLPIMKLQPNYLLMVLLIASSVFLVSSIGLLISGFYKTIMQAFGTVYFIIIAMSIPAFSYLMPFWNPKWITIIPTHHIINSFREVLESNIDAGYVLLTSGALIMFGLFLFSLASIRFKSTLRI